MCLSMAAEYLMLIQWGLNLCANYLMITSVYNLSVRTAWHSRLRILTSLSQSKSVCTHVSSTKVEARHVLHPIHTPSNALIITYHNLLVVCVKCLIFYIITKVQQPLFLSGPLYLAIYKQCTHRR